MRAIGKLPKSVLILEFIGMMLLAEKMAQAATGSRLPTAAPPPVASFR